MSRPAGDGPEPRARLPVLVLMAAVVGAVGGLGAWVFRAMIGLVHNLSFLGELGVAYDANRHTPPSPWGAGIVLAPMAGAVVVVFLVRRFAPEACGHGVPEVLEAIHYQGGVIRPVVAAIKATASAISIGTGGSVGREGPIIQIGAAFGSTFAQRVGAGLTDRQVLVAAGAAAGIAATFDAPLGGVLFAVELLLISVSARTVLAVTAAVATGMGVARPLLGASLAFDVPSLQRVVPVGITWAEAVGLVLLGVLAGLTAVGFIRSVYGLEDRLATWLTNPYLRHVVGMGVVGLIIYAFQLWRGEYVVEGVSYATVGDILRSVVTDPAVLLVFAAAKLLATSLTLGSGASGGIFSPALFVGAALGGMLGHLAQSAGMAVDPAMFAVSGMAAMIAGSTGAVMTGIVMTAEMTGDFAIALPLLVAASLATAVRKRLSPASIYSEKLFRRGHWVPEGLEAAGLRSTRARDLVEPLPAAEDAWPSVRLDADAPMTDVFRALQQGDGAAMVVDAGRRPIGVVRREHLPEALSSRRRHPSE